jgi:hypothetical protein
VVRLRAYDSTSPVRAPSRDFSQPMRLRLTGTV